MRSSSVSGRFRAGSEYWGVRWKTVTCSAVFAISGMDWIPEEDFSLYVRLPGGKGHKTRTLKLSPDNELFVSLGIRGNCSDEYLDDSYPFKKRRGGLYRINESAEPVTLEPFASGLRNPVGFDWHPESGEIYANNNGPDHLGFESPPEYFSRIMPGSFHGMPWYQYDGSTMVRDECIESEPPLPADALTLPLALFPARNAPMDMVFLPNSAKASEFAGDAIVALRGSWAVLEDDDGNPIPTRTQTGGGAVSRRQTPCRRGPGHRIPVSSQRQSLGPACRGRRRPRR